MIFFSNLLFFEFVLTWFLLKCCRIYKSIENFGWCLNIVDYPLEIVFLSQTTKKKKKKSIYIYIYIAHTVLKCEQFVWQRLDAILNVRIVYVWEAVVWLPVQTVWLHTNTRTLLDKKEKKKNRETIPLHTRTHTDIYVRWPTMCLSAILLFDSVLT